MQQQQVASKSSQRQSAKLKTRIQKREYNKVYRSKSRTEEEIMDLKSRRFESNKKYRAKLKAQKLQQLSSPSLSSQSFEVSTESVDDNLTTTSTALPAAMPAMSTISLDMLIGDTADIQCNVQYVAHRDLNIATFTYSPADQSRVPKGYVIAIHGGPAFCHNYLLPLQLLVRDGYTVIFYDQAGCGKSSFVTDPESEAPWLLSIQYYLDELQEIINFFKLDRYFLYGSSWGTIVCQEFAVKLPRGLLGLLLDGALSDAELYIRTQWRDRISTLPTLTQKLLKYCIDNGDFSSPMYKELNDTVSKHFTCRAIPSVACYHESFAGMNPVIYTKMQGECEFMIGGVLKNWSITDRLHLVQCPVLVLAGEFDTMTEECSEAIVQACPLAWPLVVVPRASHCKLLEEPEVCVAHMAKFLNTVTGNLSS